MNLQISRNRFFVVLGVLIAIAFSAHAELAPHRIQISLNLSPRPLDGAPLKDDTLFDQKASLKIKVVNLSDPAPNVQVQWMFVYDDVHTSGKIKGCSHEKRRSLVAKKRGRRQTVFGRTFGCAAARQERGDIVAGERIAPKILLLRIGGRGDVVRTNLEWRARGGSNTRPSD